ncbi:hypothetical protein MSAN_02152800 [Mycena sanguinolenta]|uniref:Transmembrane protein n=1 Tax=Mycena sanguinolenta TaxID=230812 RepID=A0A8H6XET8_9AGAR|nr:hypothetical protein MSAN_02152800 [Mycena sanguinolenta]
MPNRDYCCCAIPIVNAGIYFTLTEQFVAGIAVGVISLATPSIVGAVTPSFAPTVLGIIAFVAAGIQVLGFIGVAQEKSILFRRYITLHSLVTTAGFSVALAWIILSATKHSTAQANCITDFFTDVSSEAKSEGQTLCNIFPWVDVGVMGGLWVIMAAMHIYLYYVISGYGYAQERDHAQYDSLSTTAQKDDIAMNNRSGAYDSSYPSDPYQQRNIGGADYAHIRKESTASMSDVLSEPIQQPSDTYSMSRQGTYPPPQRQPSVPANAYTQDETPTPRGQTYYSDDRNMVDGNLEKPAFSQAHPAEGSFGRKTPRLTKGRPFDDGYR